MKVVLTGFLINIRDNLSLFCNYGSKYQQNFHKLAHSHNKQLISLSHFKFEGSAKRIQIAFFVCNWTQAFCGFVFNMYEDASCFVFYPRLKAAGVSGWLPCSDPIKGPQGDHFG